MNHIRPKSQYHHIHSLNGQCQKRKCCTDFEEMILNVSVILAPFSLIIFVLF